MEPQQTQPTENFVDTYGIDSKSKGRKKGVPNYNIEILLNVLDAILPTAQFDWIRVAADYMRASGESHLRDGADIRRFFNKVHTALRKPNQVHFSVGILERARAISLRMHEKAETTINVSRDHRHADQTYERLMMENDNDDRSVGSIESISQQSTSHSKKRKTVDRNGQSPYHSDTISGNFNRLMPPGVPMDSSYFMDEPKNVGDWLKYQRLLILSQLEASQAQHEFIRSNCERMLVAVERVALSATAFAAPAAFANGSSLPMPNIPISTMPNDASLPAALSHGLNPSVRVGIACFVRQAIADKRFLMGKLKGPQGEGKLALPGGNLGIGESWEDCAAREVYDETNLFVENLEFSAVVNSPAMDGEPNKHYVTIFMTGRANEAYRLENKDPYKCHGWQWMTWTDLLSVCQFTPLMLFEPLISLIENNQDRPF